MSLSGYPTLENKSERGVKFYFVSTGDTAIVKAIDFSFIGEFEDKQIFNLAFGDYNELEDTIDDFALSNNGDVYRVFNTVLNTIPKFFASFDNVMMMVQGSDSKQDYLDSCKANCTKGCADSENCKNKNRRISVYTRYVNNNYDELIEEYDFFGGLQNGEQTGIEPYVRFKKYDSVFVLKK